jgi:hypothetical protein
MIDEPSDEWTEDDWKELRAVAFALSDRVLAVLQDQGCRDSYSPQVAGYALIIAMGRLAGKDGYRGIPVDEIWQLWTDAAAQGEFRLAVEFERAAEN